MTDLGISLDEVRRHFENRGFTFHPMPLISETTCTAVTERLRMVLEGELAASLGESLPPGEVSLIYAAITCAEQDIEAVSPHMNELAGLVIPNWDQSCLTKAVSTLRTGGGGCSDTHDGILILFTYVPEVERVLFSIQPDLHCVRRLARSHADKK